MDEPKNSCKMFDIFIIEDDEGTGRLMQKELIRHGYEVSLAETGKQALDLIKGTKNEILLVDYKLPDMKGKQLIQKLRKKYGYSPNFVTLTGFGNEKIAVEMMKMGSRDYIVKDPEFLEILPVALKRICKELANEIKLEKTELQLKKNIGLLKETNDMARVGGWEIDLDTQKVYWTDTTKKIHEVTDDYTPDLSTAIDFFPAGARRKINNAIKQAMKNGKSYTLELPFVTAKGNKLWVVANGNPQMKNGECVRLKGTIQDITERKKNEEHLKQLNKELTEKERKNRKLAFELEERLKELRCLYSISSIIEKPDISLEEILQESVKFIPHGMQFPDKTCARVIYKNKEFKTTPFRETKIKISQQLLKKMPGQGVVEVYLNDEEKDKETFSFLKEEKELLFLVADRLGKVTDRYETNRQLKASEQQLKASNQQLEAFNQQLISGEQQLRAANQQLAAHEQQLRAANQQLAANEQQLMAANQQLAANEEELKKSNEILKKYLDVAAEIVISLDENGNIKLLNESGHRICGYAPGELTGKNWFSTCLPDESREYVKDFFVELKNNKKGGSSTYENELITKSGERKIILWHNTIFRDENGDFAGTLSSGEDITSRKRAEEKLIESEKRYRKAQEIGHIGSWEYNLENEEFWGSDEAKRIYNLDLNRKDFPVDEVMKLVAEKDREKVIRAITDLISKNKPYDIVFEIHPKNTSKRKIIRSIAELQTDESGKPLKVAGVLHDITLQKTTEAQLIHAKEKAEEADKLKTAFLANMSHEIRTPMNGILGFTDLLKNPELSGEQQQKFIEIIHKSGNRMLETVNAIIDISRIETGQAKVNPGTVNISEEIESLFSFFSREAEQKGLILSIESIPSKELTYVTDRYKFNSVFTNLIKNAIKYTKEGSIKIGCEIRNNQLFCYVKDTGIGVPEDRLSAIFNRFEQADIGDTEALEGSGLGLAIAKAYVEMLGGEIGVDSQEGKGSEFWFMLPGQTELPRDGKSDDEAGILEKNTPRKLKIIVAEDDEASAVFLSVLLKNRASEILVATSGKETVELCRKHSDADLILMDIKMPEGNGYDSLKKIREFNDDIKIIAQTANALTGDREKILTAGFDEYVSKPVKRSDLMSKIEKLFVSS